MNQTKYYWLTGTLRASLMAIFAIVVLFAWNNVDVMQETDPDSYISIHDFPNDLSYYVLSEDPSKSVPGIFSTKNTDDAEYLISFLTRVNRNTSAMIRYFDVTEEGDLVITDLSYDPDIEKFVFVYDCSRDAHSSKDIETFSGEHIVLNSFGKTYIGASVRDAAGETGYGAFSAVINEEDFDVIKKLFEKMEEKGMGTWIVEME